MWPPVCSHLFFTFHCWTLKKFLTTRTPLWICRIWTIHACFCPVLAWLLIHWAACAPPCWHQPGVSSEAALKGAKVWSARLCSLLNCHLPSGVATDATRSGTLPTRLHCPACAGLWAPDILGCGLLLTCLGLCGLCLPWDFFLVPGSLCSCGHRIEFCWGGGLKWGRYSPGHSTSEGANKLLQRGCGKKLNVTLVKGSICNEARFLAENLVLVTWISASQKSPRRLFVVLC